MLCFELQVFSTYELVQLKELINLSLQKIMTSTFMIDTCKIDITLICMLYRYVRIWKVYFMLYMYLIMYSRDH